MINPFEDINWRPGNDSLRSFARTLFVGAFAIAILFSLYNINSIPLYLLFELLFYVVIAGLSLLALSVAIPQALLPLYVIWHTIGAAIGLVTSNCILLAFFYLFFTPFAWAMRISTGRDPLRLKRVEKSNWIPANQAKDKRRYFKQY